MEYGSNGCLANFIEFERKGNSPPGWDSTQKHINIYGIALGMEYLHSLNIISLEFNRISQLNHPAILHFVGFCPHSFKKEPKPVIITELLSNQTLGDVLQMDRSNVHVSGWNATKKLMNIYGIASGMKYLHSHEIIHRNLNPNNIIMYDSCQPKLSYFGLCTHTLMISCMMNQTSSMIQGSPVYSAPEILISNECTKASDVYAFAMIAYEIITKEKANIKSSNDSCIISRTMNSGARPEFRNPIPDCYRNLIESGWSENPEERPSFDQIVDVLENVPEFITPEVDKQQYLDYFKKINSTI